MKPTLARLVANDRKVRQRLSELKSYFQSRGYKRRSYLKRQSQLDSRLTEFERQTAKLRHTVQNVRFVKGKRFVLLSVYDYRRLKHLLAATKWQRGIS